MERADAIEARLITDTSKQYDQAVSRTMRKHRDVIQRMKQLEAAEKYEQARMLARSSGLIDDLADAISSAGERAAAMIRAAIGEVRAVMTDDDS